MCEVADSCTNTGVDGFLVVFVVYLCVCLLLAEIRPISLVQEKKKKTFTYIVY